MMRIRLDLETISAVGLQSVETQNTLHGEVQTSLQRNQNRLENSLVNIYQQVDERIGRVEELLFTQSQQLKASQFNQMGHFYVRQPSPVRRPQPSVEKNNRDLKPMSTESVSVRVAQYSTCRTGCQCACHSQSRSATPGMFDRMLGQLFVGYSGLPLISPRCNNDSCLKSKASNLTFEYWFPLGFVCSQIVRFRLGYQTNIGPQLEFSTLRRVPDSAQCITFALNGNVDGLKDLFSRGLASPRDVSSTRGYSVLRVQSLINSITRNSTDNRT
jgi:hypothetical protein